MLKSVIILLVLLTSLPVGWLLAYLTREEIKGYRKYFAFLIAVSLLIALILGFFDIKNHLAIILTLVYVAVVSLVSIWKGYDKKFIKQ